MRTRTASFLSISAAALLALTGCATVPATAGSESSPSAEHSAHEAVTVEDGWIKASEGGMTAAFGELHNASSNDITLLSATTTAAAFTELHETVANDSGEMMMREKEAGFIIPAGGTLMLEPGANHIMLMDLLGPITAGEEVSFTLTFSDGSTVEFHAPVKDYAGANENYGDMDSHDMHGDHDMHDEGDHGEHSTETDN